jgi:flagellar basal-body rod protein FlgB
MSDMTIDALHSALNGLAHRQRVAADNIANIETPGFLAGKVQFEDSLRSAISAGRPQLAQTTTTRSDAPTRINGNNVNLDEETVGLIQTTLRYQLGVQGLTHKFQVLRSAIRGQ